MRFSRLRVFDSGVMVVQLQSHSEEEMIASALDNVSPLPERSSHLPPAGSAQRLNQGFMEIRPPPVPLSVQLSLLN